jgi:exosortase
VALLLGLAYADTFKGLWQYWIGDYNWRFLIPLAFVYMLRERRDLYAGLTRQPNIALGTILLAAGCLLLIAGQVSSTHTLREASVMVSVFALVILFFGVSHVRRLFWPLAYVGLMLSFPDKILDVLREPLKLLSATVATEMLQLAGYAVFRQGTVIHLPRATLIVADSCSGVNQLISAIALGIPLAFTVLNRWWQRVFILGLSVAMGVMMNWVRVFLISIWHYDSAKSDIHGPQDIYQLPFIFLVGVALTIAVALAMARRSPAPVRGAGEDASGRQDRAAPKSDPTGRWSFALPAIAAIAVVAPTAFYLTTWKPEPVPLPNGFSDFPMKIAEFAGQPIGQIGAPFRASVAQHEFAARFVDETGVGAKVYVGYFPFQNDEHELIDYRFNWLHDHASPVDTGSASAPSTPMKKTRLWIDGRAATAYFWYDVNGRQLIDPKRVKLASLVDALVSRRTNGAIIVVIFDGEVERLSLAQQEFLRQVVTATSAILPRA